MPQSHLLQSPEDVKTLVDFTDDPVSDKCTDVQECLEGDWKVPKRCLKDPLQIQDIFFRCVHWALSSQATATCPNF